MPKHIVRLLILMALLGGVAYAAKQYFTVPSFYLYGHYRGNAVADIASDKPKFKGTAYCISCHAAQTAEWSKGVHNSSAQGKVVKCEVCHGPGGSRDVKGPFEHVATGNDHPHNLKMAVPADTVKLCTLCHEQIAGRPAQQRQIVIADHAGTLQCTTCHNPHSPLTIAGSVPAGVAPGDAAAGKTLAAVCAGCHAAPAGGQPAVGPNLAGQRPAYIVQAVQAYKTGLRGNALMSGMVQNLSDADIGNVAAYYAGLGCRGGAEQDKAAVEAGRALANNCVICHGATGVSRQPLWPNLAGLSQDYDVTALKSYRDGGRKNPLMSAMAKGLSDADVTRLAAFFASIACKRSPQ